MSNLKLLLQNQGENIGFNSKMFFKSHDVAQIIQFSLLLMPTILGIISISSGGIKILDVLSIILSVFALVYHIYYGKNQELYKERGEKYMSLYHEVENYFKAGKYQDSKIHEFKDKMNELNLLKKPEYHMGIKYLVNKTIKNEMTYANEEKPRWEGK